MKSIVEKLFRTSFSFLMLTIMSCSQQPKKETTYVSPPIKSRNSLHAKFSLSDVDNKMDPSCMMPLTAGIGDTLHYLHFVLGFCSAECKKDFFKDPKGNLALAQIKTDIKR